MTDTNSNVKTGSPTRPDKDGGIQFFAAHAKDLPSVEGRRNWIEYFDYGVTASTSGRMRAQRARVKGQTQGTGWHYHVCEIQFFYVLAGSITLQLENGNTVRFERGDAALIPGGYQHSEVEISEDFDVLEVSVPADMPTVPCPVPDTWRGRPGA